ncbi:MAG TPA: LacI family DNA-binding transcriptional regulator [Propionicimonas sp.]|jgi:LacI family transcriptional regulator|nr:LacI family DNA-binding transcriptional regulator [Propionicimonas sp.]
MSRERASVKDVAERAGVSVGTVSNVLNRPESVTDHTRQRVEVAMAELNFMRNASARQLRAGVSTTVGAILMDLGNPFYTEIARGMEDRLAADGHTLMVCSSDEDPRREERFMRMFAEQGVRGILVTPMATTDERLAGLEKFGIPAVLVDSRSATHASVGVDSIHGGEAAVGHLLERGHRRIVFVGAGEHLQQPRHRHRGAVKAIIRAGLDPLDVLRQHDVTQITANEGQRAMAEALDAPGETPTAVFCINDLVALGALRELRRRGIAIPSGMAVVGYDDLYWAAELMTPLTSVRQPMRQLGWAAADQLLTGADPAEHAIFLPELVIRPSSDHWRS